jgi:hypothetical protein
MTQLELEAALDAGKLEVRMSHGKWWKARRNGKTKSALPGPAWYIPCKIGFNEFMRLTQVDIDKEPSDLRIV